MNHVINETGSEILKSLLVCVLLTVLWRESVSQSWWQEDYKVHASGARDV